MHFVHINVIIFISFVAQLPLCLCITRCFFLFGNHANLRLNVTLYVYGDCVGMLAAVIVTRHKSIDQYRYCPEDYKLRKLLKFQVSFPFRCWHIIYLKLV